MALHRPTRPGAVVFDFDGTLAHLTIDFAAMRNEVTALVLAAGIADPSVLQLYALEMVDAARALLPEDVGRRLAERSHAAIERIELEAASRGGLLPGVEEALADLRRAGVRVGVITRNCRAAVLTVAPGLLSQADALLARDDTAAYKPDPRHVLECLAVLGRPAASAVMVGDHAMDVQTARAAGVRAVGVLTGACDERGFWAAGADAVYADVPAAVRDFLRGCDVE